ncbi:MAG TPA: hypothetical protein VIK89_14890 [Cytophagaceae bacterium]
MMAGEYRPIHPDYFQFLESLMSLAKQIEIRYMKDGIENTTFGIITSIFDRDQMEYLRLDNGKEIRLDKIVSADNYGAPKRV